MRRRWLAAWNARLLSLRAPAGAPVALRCKGHSLTARACRANLKSVSLQPLAAWSSHRWLPSLHYKASFAGCVTVVRYTQSLIASPGDVKYHLGQSGSITVGPPEAPATLRLSIAPNPSHLEAVCPVVLGMVRALRCACCAARCVLCTLRVLRCPRVACCA